MTETREHSAIAMSETGFIRKMASALRYTQLHMNPTWTPDQAVEWLVDEIGFAFFSENEQITDEIKALADASEIELN